MSCKNALPLLMSLCLALAVPARAQDPSGFEEGALAPTAVQAAKDGVVVRADPGFLFKEVGQLEKGRQVVVIGRTGDWLRIKTGGWVAVADVADASRPLPADEIGTRLRVKSDAVRLRGGPGTDHEIVGRREAGAELLGLEREGDWWELQGGGWVYGSLVDELGPLLAAPDSGSGGNEVVPGGGRPQPVRRWSYMDLNGTLFEIFEVDKRAQFLAGLRQAMRDTGVLEDDWTYLRLVISVQEGQLAFHYSPAPDGNPVSVVARDRGESKRFGSVYVQGPVDRIPIHLRGFFQEQTVEAGERFEGLLMFRPTLEPAEIEKVQMLISGRARTFFESR